MNANIFKFSFLIAVCAVLSSCKSGDLDDPLFEQSISVPTYTHLSDVPETGGLLVIAEFDSKLSSSMTNRLEVVIRNLSNSGVFIKMNVAEEARVSIEGRDAFEHLRFSFSGLGRDSREYKFLERSGFVNERWDLHPRSSYRFVVEIKPIDLDNWKEGLFRVEIPISGYLMNSDAEFFTSANIIFPLAELCD